MWTAIERSDDDQTSSGRMSLQFYNASQITTEDGRLVITTTTEDTKWRGWNPYLKKYVEMKRHFKSGMLQSWNKFCFTGGIFEVDVQFPGRSDVGGLWPAVWLLGNLGRATYEASTNLMWPWSYPTCDRDLQRAQEISGCDITSHYSLNPMQGRGATEIDMIEVMPGPSGKLPICKNNLQRPYSSMTLQLAPGIPASKHRPPSGTLPEWGFHWYKNITYGENTSINPFFYGTYLGATKADEPIARSKLESYQCDALSSMVQLTESNFKEMHTFRIEWQPGEDGYIHWYMDGKFRFGIEQAGLNAEGSKIPNEPSYLILNTAISTSWGFPNPPPGCSLYDCKDPDGQCGFNPGFCKSLPARFLIDHVRVYQNKNDSRQTVGCNPREYPTKRWILAHEYRYMGTAEAHALKPIVTGGNKCTKHSQCGGFDDLTASQGLWSPIWSTKSSVDSAAAGYNDVFANSTGFCYYNRCKCKDDWQGPHCLVPTYSNDFPDWDVDTMMTPVLPVMPTFLWFCFGLLLLVMIVAITSAILKRRLASNNHYYTPLDRNSSSSGESNPYSI